MKLIVGLGNLGKEYENTRHNVGFILLDRLASFHKSTFKEFSKANCLLTQIPGFYLCKPMTFMNNSGDSVLKLSNFYKVLPKDIIVIHDDLDLEFGVIKKQFGRGSAGHNGVEDIMQKLRTKDFWRVRVGIGKPTTGMSTSDYVLNTFTGEEISKLRELELNEYILVEDIAS